MIEKKIKGMVNNFGKFYGCMFECGDFEELLDRIEEALTEISEQSRKLERERILKALPKKREYKKMPYGLQAIEGSINDARVGFNECLEEIKKLLT